MALHLGNPSREGVSRAAEKNLKDVHLPRKDLAKDLHHLDRKIPTGQTKNQKEEVKELETCNLLDNNPAKSKKRTPRQYGLVPGVIDKLCFPRQTKQTETDSK